MLIDSVPITTPLVCAVNDFNAAFGCTIEPPLFLAQIELLARYAGLRGRADIAARLRACFL